MLPVGCSSNTPVTLVILHEHAHRNSFTALVLERYIEKLTRFLEIGIHCRWQFSVFGLDCDIYRKVYYRVVDYDIIIMPLPIILHKQHNHFTLTVVAYLCIARVGGIVYKRARRYLCHILHILVAFELCHHIIWNNTLRSHEATLLECDVTAMQYCIGRILLLTQLIDAEVVDELAGYR